MLRRIRRWHFDLALILAIIGLVVGYWLIHPHPLWSVLLKQNTLASPGTINLLGFTEDGHSVLGMRDDAVSGNHMPRPMLLRWDLETGHQVAELPFQIPEPDTVRMKPYPNGAYGTMTPWQLPASSYLYVRHHFDVNDDCYCYRCYDINTGQCLNPHVELMTSAYAWPLKINEADGHLWVCHAESPRDDEPVYIRDLMSGCGLHYFEAKPGCRLWNVLVSPDKRFVSLIWSANFSRGPPFDNTLDTYRMGTWEHVQTTVLPSGQNGVISHIGRECVFDFSHVNGDKVLLKRYACAWDEKTGILSQLVLLNDIEARKRYLQPVDVNTQTTRRTHEPHPIIEYVDRVLRRFNISFNNNSKSTSIHVHDRDSGKLLRQLTGLEGYEDYYLIVSFDGNLAIARKGLGHQEVLLQLFVIPHWFWERSLQCLIYSCWLVIALWPVCFLFRRRNQQTNPHLLATGS